VKGELVCTVYTTVLSKYYQCYIRDRKCVTNGPVLSDSTVMTVDMPNTLAVIRYCREDPPSRSFHSSVSSNGASTGRGKGKCPLNGTECDTLQCLALPGTRDASGIPKDFLAKDLG
jgi:hypothetical protein